MTDELKRVIQQPEYDFLRTSPHLGKNIILLSLGGSHAYGTNVGGSDVDIRGVALNTSREILLSRDFEQVIDDATDTVVYSFKKMIKLLTSATPNMLEILFDRPEDFLYLSPIGKELVDNRELFLSQMVFDKFGGFSREQLRRLDNKTARELSQGEQEVHILNSITNASITFPEKYFSFDSDSIHLYVDDAIQEGLESEIFMDVNLHHYPLRDYKCMWSEMNNIVKDYAKIGKKAPKPLDREHVNKHAMHGVRLLLKAKTILETGTFCTYCSDEHDLLMDIRNGKYMDSDGQMTQEYFDMVAELEAKMTYAKEHTFLPEKPDQNKIDDFVCSVNERVVRGEIDESV